jgi:hypothetical protein
LHADETLLNVGQGGVDDDHSRLGAQQLFDVGIEGRGAAHRIEFVELEGEGVNLRSEQSLAIEHALQTLVAFDHYWLQERYQTRRKGCHITSMECCVAHRFTWRIVQKGRGKGREKLKNYIS